MNKTIRFEQGLLLATCLLAFFTFSGCFRQPVTPREEEEKKFYIEVPITKFSFIQAPCVDVQMEGKIFSMELDLGLRGDVTVVDHLISDISSKEYVENHPTYNLFGKEYQTDFYKIPDLRIGDMRFIRPSLQNENEAFHSDSVVVRDGGSPSSGEPGRIGWELFYNTNLLIDTKTPMIVFCDSLDTLKERGYPIEKFISVPLLLERGIVECIAETSAGPLRCSLDTGCTKNLIAADLTEEEIACALWDPAYNVEYDSFKLNGNEMGPLTFHRFPAKLPIPIEATLGMEFLKNTLFLSTLPKSGSILRNL